MYARQVEKGEIGRPRQSANAAQRVRPAATRQANAEQANAGTSALIRARWADIYRSMHGTREEHASNNGNPAQEAFAGASLLGIRNSRVTTAGRSMTQAQLQVGRVDDPLEHEADSVAERVMRAPETGAAVAAPRISVGGGRLQKQSDGMNASGQAGSMAHEVLSSPGRPLDAATRQFMETRFGRDFSQVRVHSGSAAERSAQDLHANAYTVGSNIVFGAGKWAPGTPQGNRLIAHELTHVVQQSGWGGSQGGMVQRDPKKDTPPVVTAPPSKPAAPAPSASYREDTGPSKLDQFYAAMANVAARERAKKLVDEAVKRMIAEKGPRLKELTEGIDSYKYGYQAKEEWDIHLKLIEERQKIFDEYDPSVQRTCEDVTVPGSFIRLPYATVAAPLYGPPEPFFEQYPPNFLPDKATRFGKYGGMRFDDTAVRSSVGDAYAYNIETDNFQVANDLERLARAGYTEIHIATGTHGTPGGAAGGPETEVLFMRQDARAIYETMQRHPGLKIIPYNMGDPAQVATFDALQALAADHQLPGGATIAAFCFSRTRVFDPNEGPASPYGSVEVLDGRPLRMSFTQGGFSAMFGAMMIYGGVNDPNSLVGGFKVAAGGAQVLGGASYAAGYALDSVGLVRWGSRLGEFGGYAAAPLVMYDVFRGMSRKFEPGGSLPVSGEEALAGSIEDTLKLAGIFFPEAAIGAVVLEYGVKPLAGEAAEYLTPTFLGAISQSYDIPSWRHY